MIEQDEVPYKVGDITFSKNYQPKFFDWCRKRGFDVKEVEKFKPEDKLKLILRWKWFTEDDNSASECERTRREVLYGFKGMPPQDEGTKHWLNNALMIEEETNKVKAYFGLISQTEFEAMRVE